MSVSNGKYRLAILECDDPLDETRAQLGGHIGCFKALFESTAAKFGDPLASFIGDLDITKWDVLYEQKYPDLDSVDAILVSGSRFCAYDTDPWIEKLMSFVGDALQRPRVRVIGICFGHQIIARCLGGQMRRNEKGWEISVSDVSLTDLGQSLFGKKSLSLHLVNRDIVSDYPPGVEALAFTAKAQVHGMYVRGKLITLQGHPEFTEPMTRDILHLRHSTGIVDDATFEDALPRVGRPSDGVYVAKAIFEFLQDSVGS